MGNEVKKMDTKRVLGVFIVAIIVLSCTLVSTSALIINESSEISESNILVTITGPNDEDTSSYQPKLMQDGDGFKLEVNKTVWDPVNNRWIEEINAKLGDPVTFNISVVMTNISAFCNNSTIIIEVYDVAEDFQGEGLLLGTVENDTLILSGYLNVTVTGCGSGLNLFGLEIICNDTGAVIVAEDTASVNITCLAPTFTPIGLLALVSLLSAIAAVAIVRKRH
jgi:hypothetical protein